MKRFIAIVFILAFSLTCVFAEEQVKETYKIDGQIKYDDNLIETIYLDTDIEKPEVNIPQHTLTLPADTLNITSNANTKRSALARAMIMKNTLGDILPLTASVYTQSGGFSYGSRYGEELSHSQIESTASFFLRYDSLKHFSIETALRQSANRELEDSQWSTIKISPEWHITDKLTFKDSFSNYVRSQKNKNELTLVYKPSLKKYADSLKFELSVAQSYYANGNTSQSVSFSSGFKL